ncbi:MAG: hypothetical protein KDE19_10840 [Caldilineaceae bacterium]|nr:hypothetical protein [Caldilineaceae bacterium]
MTMQQTRQTNDSQPQSYIPNPSPLDGTYATWFTPNDPKVLLYAREQLALYRDQYAERAQAYRRYPFRLLTARQTGLPIFLRGFLDEAVSFSFTETERIDGIATEWLFEEPRAGALLGRNADAARQWLFRTSRPSRLRFGKSALRKQRAAPWWRLFANNIWNALWAGGPLTDGQGPRQLPAIDEADELVRAQIEAERQMIELPPALQAHVPFQQWHGEWPLFGAQVVVHLTSDDERASVTSSYLPIDTTKAFEPVLTEPEAAFAFAFIALREYLEISGLMQQRKISLADPSAWSFHIAPYADQPQFILPFAGDYHLVYQVEMISPDYEQRWRAFVDCEREIVLGQPEPLKLDAQYYAVAADALAGPQNLQNTQLTTNPCASFMEIGVYQAGAPSNDDTVVWGQSNSPSPHFEAANVAVHSKKLFDYFVELGVAQSDLEQVDENSTVRLRARVAKPGLPALDMGFYFDVTIPPQQQWINFQTDNSANQGGLPTLKTKRVHHPVYDPEVIYHEVTHAFTWLMNRDAFDGCNGNVPFGRALLEGYANYFARSLAARYEAALGPLPAAVEQPWARAAYRTDTTAEDWCDRWALVRGKELDGQDRLPVPNLYPSLDTTGLPVYDVGMIWGRGMWDLRKSFIPFVLDEFALGAFDYLHGWIATPELVVEGMIDVAKSTVDGPAGFDATAEMVFAKRGIVANQRVQAITSWGTTVLIGGDAGLLRSFDDGQTWQIWDEARDHNGATLDPLRNVVDLTVDGGTFYAATEAGIWQRHGGDPAWQPLGDWPSTQTPYVIRLFEQTVYIGTGNGIWWYDAVNNQWHHLVSQNPTSTSDFVGALLDFTFAALTNGEKWLVVAAFGAARICNITTLQPHPAVLEWLSIANKDHLPICSVAVRGDELYLGTANGGLQQLSLLNPFVSPLSDAPSTAVDGTVLTLINRPHELIAASTTGLFAKDFSTPNKWDKIPLPACAQNLSPTWPADAKILTVHRTDTATWISTATHGLWQLTGDGLCPINGIAAIIA